MDLSPELLQVDFVAAVACSVLSYVVRMSLAGEVVHSIRLTTLELAHSYRAAAWALRINAILTAHGLVLAA